MNVEEALKKHKIAVAIGSAGIVLLYILTRSSDGSSSSGGNDGLQIAALQSNQNLQQAQIQAQQNMAQISATTQDTQTAAELNAQQSQLAVEAALGLQQQGSQASLEKEALDAEVKQNATYENLVAGIAPNVSSQLLSGKLAGHEAEQESDVNLLGLLLGNESGLGSYNSTISNQGIAGDQASTTGIGDLLGLLEGSNAGNALKGLMAGL
jgi:hypothetical protein